MRMDMLDRIDWVGDDGLFKHEGRSVAIQRIGDDVFVIAEQDCEDESVTVVGDAGLSYWLQRWVHG